VAIPEINKKASGYESHVGVMGIAIKNGFRDVDIGTQVLKTLINKLGHHGFESFNVSAFATNKRVIHVYEKVGFVVTGRTLKKLFKEDKYIDEIMMTEALE
jgi:ribosomal protein S18 acetylase RimI-like enzyme